MSESVVIHTFWSRQHGGRDIVFHARNGGGTQCEPNRYSPQCGHALPREVAEKIAQPCKRCYRNDRAIA